jgi:hypothetical protein
LKILNNKDKLVQLFESFRNEVVKSNNENRQLYIDMIQQNGILPVNVTSLTSTHTLPENSGE